MTSGIFRTVLNSADLTASQAAQDAALLGGDGALVGLAYAAPGAVMLNLKAYAEDDGAYSLMGFVSQASKAAIRNGTSTVDQSAAITDWLTAAYSESMRGGYVPRGIYPVIAGATLTMTGNRINQGMTIRGAGRYGSRIVKLSGLNAPLTFQSSSPTTAHTDAQLVIEDLGLFGASKGSHGLSLQGIAGFHLNRLLIRAFDTGLKLDSSLVGRVSMCEVTDNNIGIITRRSGTAAYCNAIRFEGGVVKYNSTRGMDIGHASGIWIGGGIDIERNGTALAATTGGLIIRDTVDDETGYGLIVVDGAWFESNLGRTVHVENTVNLFFNVLNSKLVSAEAGLAMLVAGARSFSFKDSFAVGNSSVLDITADKFTIENSLADIIVDNATFSVYSNAATSTAEYVSGRTDSFTGTLTGCTTSPTGTVGWTKQGKTVTLNIPEITGLSATTAATITGMPAALYPSVNRTVMGVTRDNGTEKFSPISIGSTGTITLNNGFTAVFTGTGTKGVSSATVTYER